MAESTQRFLVIRLSSIGDIVHALPAVAALGETFPQAEIHWAVETRFAMLLDGNPFVRRLIKLDTLGWRKKIASLETFKSVARGAAALREVTYDTALDFQGLYKSAAIAWLSRSRARLGFNEAWLREPVAAMLYTERVSPGGRKHVIEMNMALAERAGAKPVSRSGWKFPLPRDAADDCYVEQRLAALGAPEFIVINPGGGWKSKCWSPDAYAELLGFLRDQLTLDFLLTGSTGEEPLIQNIVERSSVPRARYFPSTISQFIALVRRAKLFLGGDTGPMHLAAAVGTPIVAIYGPTNPERNGPFSPLDIALWNRGPVNHTRRNASAGYIEGVTVESVLAAIRERLARTHG
ncbi:MAG: glycosyltransferase family 9 protein [Acidobacteriia bacterium]|nr:glycosyltransferase family 9 protein [Terriglobia bacterium]